MTQTPETLHQLADAIAARIAAPIPIKIDLWSTVEIGAWLKHDPRYIRERVVCLPSFPRPIRIPAKGAISTGPRWRAVEVIEWAEQFQTK